MSETVFDNLRRHIPVSARERRRQVPVRAGLALLLAAALAAIGNVAYAPLWLLTTLAVQAVEWVAMAPFLKPDQATTASRGQVAFFIVATILMSLNYSGLAALFAWHGGYVPLTVALLIIAGGMLNNVASGVGSRPLFVIGALPYAAALIVLPLAARISAALLAILLVSLLLFVIAVYAIWKRTHASRRAHIAAREEAERRQAEAEEAVADRAAMAAIVSHELRTPLSAILAGAHLIGQEADDPAVRARAALIVDAGRLMTGLLNDLLDNAKIEAGAMTLEPQPFDLTACLEETAAFWSAVAGQKGLALNAPLGAAPRWVMGDSHRLRQILNNLLSNAIKFTPEGAVTVRLLNDEGDRVRIVVRDQGPGLSDDAVDRLFEPYAQGSNEVARNYGGTGLGLAVSRDLARLMGGDITAAPAPAGSGGGADFRLDIALPPAPPPPEPSEQEAWRPPAGLRVLAVDDHEINRRTLALVLAPIDARVTTAVDGISALEMLAQTAFDVVLMDVNMPGIDGVEATRRLRAAPGPNRDVPVIGFSAGVEAEQVRACLEGGMNDWIGKPLEPRRLYQALAQITPALDDA